MKVNTTLFIIGIFFHGSMKQSYKNRIMKVWRQLWKVRDLGCRFELGDAEIKGGNDSNDSPKKKHFFPLVQERRIKSLGKAKEEKKEVLLLGISNQASLQKCRG